MDVNNILFAQDHNLAKIDGALNLPPLSKTNTVWKALHRTESESSETEP